MINLQIFIKFKRLSFIQILYFYLLYASFHLCLQMTYLGSNLLFPGGENHLSWPSCGKTWTDSMEPEKKIMS